MDWTDSCRFCNIIRNNKMKDFLSDSFPIYDMILYETANFLVLPALGALVPGYLMIISRKHISSMAYVSEKEMDELAHLVKYLKCILSEKFGIIPILFEHGSVFGFESQSACSVEHAHWHLVPIHLSNEVEMLRDINAINILGFKAIRSYKDETYLLYVNQEEQFYVSKSTMLPSQYMRKWIAKEMGYSLEWDWRQYKFIDNINDTIMLFRN